MESIYRILEFIINFFEAFIWYRMGKIFLHINQKRRFPFLMTIILWIGLCIKSVVSWKSHEPVLTISVLIICIIYILGSTLYTFSDNFGNKLAIALCYIMATAVINLIVMGFFMLLNKNLTIAVFSSSTFWRFFTEITGKIILIALLEYINKKRNAVIIDIDQKVIKFAVVLILTNLVLFLGVYVLFCNTRYLTEEMVLLYIAICVIIMTGFSAYTLNKLAKSSKEILKEKLKVQNAEAKFQLMEDMSILIQNLRKLRHDMNDHLGVIQGLIDIGQYDSLKSYVEKISEKLYPANDFVLISDEAFFIILNIKKALAAEKDISFESTIILNTLPLSDLEVCSLFGNILDNAIEAAEISEDKYIDLSIKETKNAWNIQCINSYLISPVFEGDDILKSTKNNKEIHGIGTQNIKEIVMKYGGAIAYEAQNGCFKVNISLPKVSN